MLSIIVMVIACLCLFALPTEANAAREYVEGYYTYTVSNGNATIVQYDDSVCGSLTIPSTLNGYPVTQIGYNAFAESTVLTGVTIPDSVVCIGEQAFEACPVLTSVVIGRSVTEIGDYAFNCCEKLKTVTFSNSLTTIGAVAFGNCESLTSIKIPDSVTTINESAFSYCSGLSSVVIGNSVVCIDWSMFAGCTDLQEITIPTSVTSIASHAFSECENLMRVYYAGTRRQWNNIEISDWNNDYLLDADLYLQGSCAHVYDNGCDVNCNICTAVRKELTHTYEQCCKECKFCGAIRLEITHLWENDCDNLCDNCGAQRQVGDHVYDNACDAFCNICNAEREAADHIYDDGCDASCNICGTVREELEHDYDSNCDEECNACGAIRQVGAHKYEDDFDVYCDSCGALSVERAYTYVVDDNEVMITHCSTAVCDDIVIPDELGGYPVTAIASYAFSNCENLTHITIPDSITYIGENAFEECVGLTDIVLGDGIMTIANSAFADCSSLTEVIIPDSVATIGESAFAGCENLSEVTIGIGVNTIETSAFSDCYSIELVYYIGTETQWAEMIIGDDNDALINADIRCLGCEHAYRDATCTAPKTCRLCGATDGAPLGHSYKVATCTSPKTCKRCSYTKGVALGHSYGLATCTKAKTCKRCEATSGSALGHKYDSGKVNTKATCKVTGVKTFTCTVCKGINKQTIAKLTTHTYSNACDTKCNICGKTRTVPAHKYSNACDTACNVCKAKRTITHKYKTTTTKATLKKNGSVVKKCTVCDKVASKTTVRYVKTVKLSDTSYTYNGKVKNPAVTVKDSAGKTLKKGTDYTVKYSSGCKNVGTYKVTITFKGKYSGTKVLTFKILPKAASVNKLTAKTKAITVKINRSLKQSSGYQIQYATSKSFKSYKTTNITKYTESTKTISGLKAKTTYYVRVRTYKTVGGVKIYSNWSTAKSVKTK